MDRTQRLAWLCEEVRRVVNAEVERELDGLCSGDLQAVEGRLQQVLRVVGGALVGGLAQLRLAALAGQPVRCPQCGGATRYVAQRPRHLEGLVGPVQLRRPYYHCAACARGLAPLDEAWGLGAGGLTPALARVACRDGIEAAFGEGADLLHQNLGVWVDEEQVRTVSEALGAVIEADQTSPACWALPPEVPVPALIVLELDGVLLHEVDAWREMKVGRVAPLGPALVVNQQTGDAHLALGASTDCVGREEAAAFWPRVMRELVRAGWGRGVRVVVLIADGADWIWHQARCQVRRDGVLVVEILDFYHASEHLAAVAKAVFGVGSLRASDWLDRQCHALRHQGPTPVRRALAKLAPPSEAAADLVRKACLYFRTHAHRMNYPAFRARQFPIGSGAIESCAKNLIQARQVQAGMRWTTRGAQCLASLRALHRSGRWDTFWRSQPQRRLCLLHPRKPWSHATTRGLPIPTDPTAPAPPPPTSVLAPPASRRSAPPSPQPAPPVPPHPRIQTAGKPWAKGKDHWRRGLPRTA
jgi:hypothetical protein